MPRTDEDLYTGMSSATLNTGAYEKVKASKAVLEQVKQENTKVVLPVLSLIKSVTDEEKNTLKERFYELITIDSPEQEYKSLAVALRLYEQYLNDFERRLSTKINEASNE